MMNQLTKLLWDSNFFGIEIAEYFVDENNPELEINSSDFDLIVAKSITELPVKIKGAHNNFSETKLTYKKPIVKNESTIVVNDVYDYDITPLPSDYFYELAFESGKFSRFKLDSNFTLEDFENLYKEWVTNSLNKSIASKVFYTQHDEEITGFVTLKQKNNKGFIGLIGVKKEFQGHRLGTQLIQKVESYSRESDIETIYVDTQMKNKLACKFYEKNNFTLDSRLVVSHFWCLS